MTPKMQREDAVSGFSFLFPARYSAVQGGSAPLDGHGSWGWIRGCRQAASPPERQVQLTASAQLKIPLGIASPSCRDVKPKWM